MVDARDTRDEMIRAVIEADETYKLADELESRMDDMIADVRFVMDKYPDTDLSEAASETIDENLSFIILDDLLAWKNENISGYDIDDDKPKIAKAIIDKVYGGQKLHKAEREVFKDFMEEFSTRDDMRTEYRMMNKEHYDTEARALNRR